MKEVKIQVKNLSFRYDSRDVLKNVSFEIYDKDIVTIIGPNGGGKSTLLKLLLGILKPDSGTILIDGVPPKKLKKPVLGYVPQYSLFDPRFPISVFETVLSGRMKEGLFRYTAEDREIAEQIAIAQQENASVSTKSIRLCGEMASDMLFVEDIRAKLPEFQLSLMDSFSNLRLPIEEADSAAVLSCAGAIGAALNVMEGV